MITSAIELDPAAGAPFAEAATPPGLRIAVLALGRYSGGSPIGLHLTRALADRAVVRAFVGQEAVNLDDWRRASLDIEVCRTYRSAAGAAASLLWPRRLWRMARLIRAFSPDVVLLPFIHPWALPLLKRAGVPGVVFVHDPHPHPGLSQRLWHLLDRAVARRAARVIVHSRRFVPRLQATYGLQRSQILIVPIGPLTDYTTGADAQTSQGRIGASREILCFGRMTTYKGVEILIRAAAGIRRMVPDATIRIAGDGLEPALKVLALSTPGVVVDDGWVSEGEVPAYFRRAAVVVLPYTSGTQSGVIPIAAAFGVPVVASDVGGLGEQLADGRCGLLVPPGNPDALGQAIVSLLEHPDRAASLGAALHDEYRARRSWAFVASEVLAACTQAAWGASG